MEVESIGIFHCIEKYPYDVPRQGIFAGANRGIIELHPGKMFEQALVGLDTFSHIWVLFQFNQADKWKPMVRPPRHTEKKMGVFATRAPYRPNHIGMSCVRLLSVNGLRIEVEGHDLLDGTPVLDIKPYLPFADSFPEASSGWTAQEEKQYKVQFTPVAEAQLQALEQGQAPCIRAFILDRLGMDPLNAKRNRMVDGMLAYRYWRVAFDVRDDTVLVLKICASDGTDIPC